MPNIQNLIPNSQRTEEELHIMRVNGGKKSAKVKKEKKMFKEIINEKLNKLSKGGNSFKELSVDRLIEFLSSSEIRPNDYIKVLEFIRDTIGEKPIEKVETIITEVPQIIDNIVD